MTTWTHNELTRIAAAEEQQLAAARRDGTLRKPVTIWVVRNGDDLCVRSAYGRASRWFRATQERHEARIRVGTQPCRMRPSWLRFLMVCLVLALSVWGCGSDQTSDQTGQPQGSNQNILIDNQLTKDSAPACIYADPQKLVSLFNPDQQTVGPGMTGPYTIPGGQFGLQVNFWYWAQTPYMGHAIGTWSCAQGQCNNPDNSGAQFTLGAGCSIASQSPPVFGVGKETYIITDVSAGMQNGDCVITIKPNQYTGCVTPSCCDYAAPGQCSEGTQGTYATGCTTPPP